MCSQWSDDEYVQCEGLLWGRRVACGDVFMCALFIYCRERFAYLNLQLVSGPHGRRRDGRG